MKGYNFSTEPVAWDSLKDAETKEALQQRAGAHLEYVTEEMLRERGQWPVYRVEVAFCQRC